MSLLGVKHKTPSRVCSKFIAYRVMGLFFIWDRFYLRASERFVCCNSWGQLGLSQVETLCNTFLCEVKEKKLIWVI